MVPESLSAYLVVYPATQDYFSKSSLILPLGSLFELPSAFKVVIPVGVEGIEPTRDLVAGFTVPPASLTVYTPKRVLPVGIEPTTY